MIKYLKNIFKHKKHMFYISDVCDMKKDPCCYKCGKKLSECNK